MNEVECARVIELLQRDVIGTIGEAHAAYTLHRAAELRAMGLASDEKLVEDVQQEIHDTFVDTSWPECPRHGKHPLWYRAGAWYCDAVDRPVAMLGTLAELRRRQAPAR
ncbi:MAG: hypothetical protein ABI051_16315 [Vicinamibacterales bacterium]